MNPWRHTAYEREPGNTVAEGLADRADLNEELRHQVRHLRPDMIILEELQTLRFAVAAFGLAILTVSVASFGVLLYAVLGG